MQLIRLTHHAGAERPLLVEFTDDAGAEHKIEATAALGAGAKRRSGEG